MLLLDDDDELPTLPNPSEAKLSVQVGEQGLRAIDAALVSHAKPSWLKVARVVHDALGSGGFVITDEVVRLHVRRVAALVEVGSLEAQGNLRRPRFSEVRLPQR
jgi:Protein of unknown function